MAGIKTNTGVTKLRRESHRHGKQPMKLVRVWVPDPASPEFEVEAQRQAALLRGAEEELEALRFAEAVVDWPPA